MSKYNHKPNLNILFDIPSFQAFSNVDLDADGFIDYKETKKFIAMKETKQMKHETRTQGNNTTSRDISNEVYDIHSLFQEVDTNKDGYIEPKEFDRDLS